MRVKLRCVHMYFVGKKAKKFKYQLKIQVNWHCECKCTSNTAAKTIRTIQLLRAAAFGFDTGLFSKLF